MNKTIEFSDWTTSELFDYLMDNLVIPDDSELEYWKHFRADMMNMCRDFYENHQEMMEL